MTRTHAGARLRRLAAEAFGGTHIDDLCAAAFQRLFDTLKVSGRESEFEHHAGRGTALSWAGAGVATFLGGPVAAITSTEVTIYIGAATCVATAFIAFAMKEPLHSEGESHENYWSGIARSFGQAFRTVDLRWVILLSGAAFAAIQAVEYLVQPYLVDRGLEVGLLFSMLQVPMIFAGAVGAFLAAAIARRMGAYVSLIALPVVGVAG